MSWCRPIKIMNNNLNKGALKGGILCIKQEVNQGFGLEVCLDPIILTMEDDEYARYRWLKALCLADPL